MNAMSGEAKIDGRALRRERNRTAVLDAAFEIFAEGHIEPSVERVADRAGVSNRSIYRYFEDRDHLEQAAVTHAVEQILPELHIVDLGLGTLQERIDRFVEHRLRIHQRYGAVIRAVRRAAETQPAIAQEIEAAVLVGNALFSENFARELAIVGPAERLKVSLGAQMPFRIETVEFLWNALGGEIEDVREVLTDHLVRVLEPLSGSVPISA